MSPTGSIFSFVRPLQEANSPENTIVATKAAAIDFILYLIVINKGITTLFTNLDKLNFKNEVGIWRDVPAGTA